MKFIHAADIHLGSPFLGLKSNELPNEIWQLIKSSTQKAFEKLINTAIHEKVDFILFAGDTLDSINQDTQVRIFLYEQLLKLNQQNIPVYMILGNHDYGKTDLENHYPNNVHLFNNDVQELSLNLNDGTKVKLVGFSFLNRWTHERIIIDYPPKQGDADWYIGLLHGSLEGINTNEEKYAPFSITELTSKNYDYWALGHIHKRQSLNSNHTINYSGNLQGRHINESGEKGFLLVESNQSNQLVPKFIEASTVNWSTLEINHKFKNLNRYIDDILVQIEQLELNKLTLIRLNVTEKFNPELAKMIENDELISRLHLAMQNDWNRLHAWIIDIKFIPSDQLTLNKIDQEFYSEAQQQIITDESILELGFTFNQYPFIKEELSKSENLEDIKQIADLKMQENLLEQENGTIDN